MGASDKIESTRTDLFGGRFISVPLCCQETEYNCGTACVQSILKYYGLDYRQDELIGILHTKPIYGTDYHAILRFMDLIGFKASFFENRSIDYIRYQIDSGVTPLLLIQAWADEGADYEADWKDNHYVIACGYEGDRISFMDPYTLGNFTYMETPALMRRWHAADENNKRYYGAGLTITKDHCPFKYDPRDIKYLG